MPKDGKTKKQTIKNCLLLFLMMFLFLFTGCVSDKVIGEVYGTEHEYLQIGEDTYTLCNNPGVNKNRDRDGKLGKVVFRNNPRDSMTVWSLKGYSNREYIYTLWLYDGAYYKKD